jgi:hypothetical protein
VTVLSNDLQKGLYFLDREHREVIYAPTSRSGRFDMRLFRRLALDPAERQFEALLRHPTPQSIVLDDTNTLFTDWRDKVTKACLAGVPLQNITFLVADQQLPTHEEADFLIRRQDLRKQSFWAQVDAGHVGHPSDGKVVPSDKIRQMVERMRVNYFDEDGSLRLFTVKDLEDSLQDREQYGIVYTGLFLTPDAASRALAFARAEFGTLLPTLAADLHCTLAFGQRRGLSREEQEAMGKTFRLTVTGRTAATERVQALAVSHDCPVASRNDFPHVTVAMADGVRPAESNAALQRAVDPVAHPIVLEARMGVAATLGGRGKAEVLYRL